MINAVFNIYWPETAKLPSHTLFVFVGSTLIHIATFLGVHDYPRALKATLQPITRALKTDIRDKKKKKKQITNFSCLSIEVMHIVDMHCTEPQTHVLAFTFPTFRELSAWCFYIYIYKS